MGKFNICYTFNGLITEISQYHIFVQLSLDLSKKYCIFIQIDGKLLKKITLV